VNLVAIEEYEETEQRHQFLTKQHDDLVSAKAQLLEVINRINVQTRQMFVRRSRKSATISAAMFVDVFGGGKADLILWMKTTFWKAALKSWRARRANNCKAFRCCPAASRR
jgi:chromosome segregation ATPase